MAMIADALLSHALQWLAGLAEEEVTMMLGLSGDIKELEATMKATSAIIKDVKKNHLHLTSEAVKEWLRDLDDFMYEADDILDLCKTELADLKPKEGDGAEPQLPSCCPAFVLKPVTSHGIGWRIKDVKKKLDAINKKWRDLGVQFNATMLVGQSHNEIPEVLRHLETSSIPVNETVGEKIEEDARMLVEVLTRKELDMVGAHPCVVVAIVGAGGIGKTTLAQKVFNHPTINDDFDGRAWLHAPQVLDPSSEIRLLQSVIELLGESHGDAQRKEVLQQKLEKVVKGNKIMMVLDDMWEVVGWEKLLMAPLRSCSLGSRIIITTRNVGIVRSMNAAFTHPITKLNDEDGYALLKKEVLTHPNDKNEVDTLLREFGLKIIQKCEGLPLAIRSVGGVLRQKNADYSGWKRVLESSVWSINGLPEDINRAVYLSYEDLPSHLKQCFLCLASLIKSWHQFLPEICSFWIAEGFLTNQNSGLLEQIAEESCRELVARNLVQFSDEEKLLLTMHDVIRDFGRYLTKEHTIYVGNNLDGNACLGKARQIYIEGNIGKPNFLRKQISTRTMFIHDCPQVGLDDITKRMSGLRILNLAGSAIERFPDSIYQLKQLRYLSACNTKLKSISPKIKNLKTLQYLALQQCKMLEDLPNTIVELIELRGLWLDRSNVQAIPVGLEKLQNMVDLDGFVPMQQGAPRQSSNLDAIGVLPNLRYLSLNNLNNALVCDSSRQTLREKPYLEYLLLKCKSMLDDQGKLTETFSDVDVSRIENLFSQLQPPTCLKLLLIGGFFGSHLPNWLSRGSNLTQVVLQDLPYCMQLPSLGELPNLKFCWITYAVQVEKVGDEFLGVVSGSRTLPCAFPKLERLKLIMMVRWSDWCWHKEMCAMENLRFFKLEGCKLPSLPEGLLSHANALTRLEILGCDDFVSIECLRSVKELQVDKCSKLERITDLPAIQTITISNCPSLRLLQDLESLRTVILTDYKITELSEWLLALKNLYKLELYCNPELLKLIAEGDSGSEWHKIKHVQQVKAFTEDKAQYILYTKEPFDFSTNIVI